MVTATAHHNHTRHSSFFKKQQSHCLSWIRRTALALTCLSPGSVGLSQMRFYSVVRLVVVQFSGNVTGLQEWTSLKLTVDECVQCVLLPTLIKLC